MDEEIEALEKSGATETATKLREKWKAHATAHDTLKAEHSGVAKKLAQAERELAKYKADLEAASKGADERVSKLAKEREDLAAQAAKELEDFRLRVELGDKLGIADAKTRKRALDVFLAEYRPEGAGLTDKGELQGFDAALDAFKKAEPIFFAQAGYGGGRAGADPKPQTKAGPGGDKVQSWAAKLFPQMNAKA
jgi:hypothetical protein